MCVCFKSHMDIYRHRVNLYIRISNRSSVIYMLWQNKALNIQVHKFSLYVCRCVYVCMWMLYICVYVCVWNMMSVHLCLMGTSFIREAIVIYLQKYIIDLKRVKEAHRSPWLIISGDAAPLITQRKHQKIQQHFWLHASKHTTPPSQTHLRALACMRACSRASVRARVRAFLARSSGTPRKRIENDSCYL